MGFQGDLPDYKQLLEQAQQKAEQERRRADRLEEQVFRQDEEAQQRQHQLDQYRSATLTEYLFLWDKYLPVSIVMHPNPAVRTKGTASNVEKKHRPSTIVPWGDYLQKHCDTLKDLDSVYSDHSHDQVFPSVHRIQEDASTVASQEIASESDVEIVVRTTFEMPTKKILSHLHSVPTVCGKFFIPDKFQFTDNKNRLSGTSEDITLNESAPPSTPPYNARVKSQSGGLRADQYFIYERDQGLPKTAFTAEFKPRIS